MSDSLQFWLSFNNGAERLRLPVNPETNPIGSGHGFDDIDVTGLGELTIIGDEKLREFSIQSFFPRDYNPSFCEYVAIPLPWDAVQMIERWQKSGRPCRLTVTGTPINYPVTIRSFQYAEKGGEPGDIYFTLSLKEFKFVTFRTVDSSSGLVSGTVERPSQRVPPTSYVVQSGDFLWQISHKTLGNGDRWREIYDLNVDTIGPDPDVIQPGMTLVIP